MSLSLIQYDPEAVKVTRQDFEKHRTVITKLYKINGLKQVMQTMETTGFKASRRQYTQILKTWGIEKNKPAKDMKVVARKYIQRNSEGKLSTIRWRGNEVAPEDIHRFISRNPAWNPASESASTTPSHIECDFPESVLEAQALGKAVLSPAESLTNAAGIGTTQGPPTSLIPPDQRQFTFQRADFPSLAMSGHSSLFHHHHDFPVQILYPDQQTQSLASPTPLHSQNPVMLHQQADGGDETESSVAEPKGLSNPEDISAFLGPCLHELQQIDDIDARTQLDIGKKQDFGDGIMASLGPQVGLHEPATSENRTTKEGIENDKWSKRRNAFSMHNSRRSVHGLLIYYGKD
ncbi:hypothetical protein LTR84_003763 [Exophiala bonariae]|uniref:Clr5 domain-containing protein n=1 Tax=Exophiala bonariae TaxID=1690606 RepID=A0AAV9N6F7_9EURO|nr:hypothetical protein LTR84_003763 [Exophiala bonariae]